MSYVRTIIASIRVGWSRDFSWTNPFLGFALKTVAPVASTMTAATILFIGLTRGTGSNSIGQQGYLLASILIGATLYAHISAYSWVPTLAIAEGKWTFVFPQVYVSPQSSPPYLAGRCLAAFCSSTVTSMASLVIAGLVSSALFQIPMPFVITPLTVTLLAVALVVNILASMGLGFLLGGYSIFASKFEWALPTYVSGLLMIFSGALFPVTALPRPFSDIANILPFTAFIRATRQVLLPDGSLYSYAVNLAVSFVGGVVLLAIGLLAFRYAEQRARKLGVLDRKVV